MTAMIDLLDKIKKEKEQRKAIEEKVKPKVKTERGRFKKTETKEGKPCKRCGSTTRYLSNGNCYHCNNGQFKEVKS